jgi:hypothetical protein
METRSIDLADDDAMIAHRARARNLLPQITQQVRHALNDAGIDLSVFVTIPSSGGAIATFGTTADPPDAQWRQVAEIVSSVVRQSVGLTRTRCREIAAASTDDAVDHLPAVSMPEAEDAEPDHRFKLPRSHPHLATVTLDPINWHRFQQLAEDNPGTRVMGHEVSGGTITVHVACADDEVRDRLEDAWG